uniref:FAD_binding_2 domain-containing protein n=1 Tax=Macrostomum lignano TaxID=282301 RepID=A0A1I8HFA8_9PLAT
ALGIEVLLSEEKPAGLDEDAPNCTAAAFSHSLSGFQHCGFTRNDSSNSLRSHLVHEVTCSAEADGKMAQYVLLRKFVANQTDKMMNFELLEIEKRDCFQQGGLGQLSDSENFYSAAADARGGFEVPTQLQ